MTNKLNFSEFKSVMREASDAATTLAHTPRTRQTSAVSLSIALRATRARSRALCARRRCR